MARSTFRSENVQNTPFSDHFWKLRCPKSGRRCGAKHISKSKCTKHTILGPLLEVAMSIKCTPLWCEAHFQVKMLKTLRVRTTFGSSDLEKVHTVVARSTFPSQNVQNTPGPDHFWRFRCRKSARRCGAKHISKVQNTRGSDHFWRFRCRFASLHYITLHYTPLHCTALHYTTLHNTTTIHNYTPLHSTRLHYTTLHYTTLHYTALHYLRLHFTTLHYTTLHYTTTTATNTQLHSTTLHYTKLHYTTLHYTTLHYIPLHSTTLHCTTLPSATLHYITLHYTTFHYTPLHYTTLHYATLIGLSRALLAVPHGGEMKTNAMRPASAIKVCEADSNHVQLSNLKS